MDPHDKAVIHSSFESDYRTPPEAVVLLHKEFGFCLDLAADADNHVVPHWLGPGSNMGTAGENALTCSWNEMVDGLGYRGAVFINPPFSKTRMNAYRSGRIKINGEWVAHEIDLLKAESYDIANWAEKCWKESQQGLTVVGVFPFVPQTEWYRAYVYGHALIDDGTLSMKFTWSGHAAREERRLPHRISFLQPDGSPTGNAGVNSVIIVWKPNYGIVGPWQPHQFYWSYR